MAELFRELSELTTEEHRALLATPPRHPYREVCAMLILAELDPGQGDRGLGCAEHDEVWLSADPEVVAAGMTRDLAVELVVSGVRFYDDGRGFAMFV